MLPIQVVLSYVDRPDRLHDLSRSGFFTSARSHPILWSGMDFINQIALKIEILNGIQVLVVDNDRDTQHLYATLLKDHGAKVITAGSVKEAVDIFSWFLPDVLISEMRFSGESIDTLTTKLSEMEADRGDRIFAIATTTWIGGSLTQKLVAGFEGFLLKPINLDQLVAMLRELVVTLKDSPPSYGLKRKSKLKIRCKRSRQDEITMSLTALLLHRFTL